MRTISSRQNDVVRRFRALAATPDATGARLLLDGAHVVGEAERAGLAFEIVAVAASKVDTGGAEGQLARALADRGVEVVVAGDDVLEAMSPVRTPGGLVAIAQGRPVQPSEICRKAGFILAAADIQDPGNLGSLIRAAEAGGVDGVIVCGASASPFSWKAIRGSMGSVLRLPVASVPSVASVLACMTASGLRTVAAVPRGGDAPEDVDWRGDVGVILGGEGPGLADAIVDGSDARVTIPMAPPVESLNVAVAGALLVYAARRQRS